MPASADSSQKLNHDAIAMASFFQRTARACRESAQIPALRSGIFAAREGAEHDAGGAGSISQDLALLSRAGRHGTCGYEDCKARQCASFGFIASDWLGPARWQHAEFEPTARCAAESRALDLAATLSLPRCATRHIDGTRRYTGRGVRQTA
jgi:hypothetical protein